MSKFRNQYLSCLCGNLHFIQIKLRKLNFFVINRVSMINIFSLYVVNITSFAYGLAVGWCSYNTPILLSDDSPLESGPVTIAQMSWIASIYCLGGGIGSFIFGFIADKIGRKYAMLCCGICQIIGWALALYTPYVEWLYVSRSINGLSVGGAYVTIPIYITEISDKT